MLFRPGAASGSKLRQPKAARASGTFPPPGPWPPGFWERAMAQNFDLDALACHVEYLADCLEVFVPCPPDSNELDRIIRLQLKRRPGLYCHVAALAAWRLERILNPDCLPFDSHDRHTEADVFSLELGGVLWHLRTVVDAIYPAMYWEFICEAISPPGFWSFTQTYRLSPPSVPDGAVERLRAIARLLRVPHKIPDVLVEHGRADDLKAEMQRLAISKAEPSIFLRWKEWGGVFDCDWRTVKKRATEAGAILQEKTKNGVKVDLKSEIFDAEILGRYEAQRASRATRKKKA